MSEELVYAAKSTIPNAGNGLFAKSNIKFDSKFVEFTGVILSNKEESTDSRSNIHFWDNTILQCYPTDLASNCNDCICFPTLRRKLVKSLKSNKPFYKKHLMASVNARIEIDNDNHRAYLRAIRDIKIGEEIFCHYGFNYWFINELQNLGFAFEEEIEKNGYPVKIFEYPAFVRYLKEFYPDLIKFEIKPSKDFYDVILTLKDNRTMVVALENFFRSMELVRINSK